MRRNAARAVTYLWTGYFFSSRCVGAATATAAPYTFYRSLFCCILAQLVFPYIIYLNRAQTLDTFHMLLVHSGSNTNTGIHIFDATRPAFAHTHPFLAICFFFFVFGIRSFFISVAFASFRDAKFSVKRFCTNARVLRKILPIRGGREGESGAHPSLLYTIFSLRSQRTIPFHV